ALGAQALADGAYHDVAIGDHADQAVVGAHGHHAGIQLGHRLGDLLQSVIGRGDPHVRRHDLADLHARALFAGVVAATGARAAGSAALPFEGLTSAATNGTLRACKAFA